ncbi:hypothetical protein [Rhodocaloribacter sp.]
MRFYSLLLLGTLLLTGCSEIISESPGVKPEPTFNIFQAPDVNLFEMSKTEVSAFFKANETVRRRGEQIIESAGDWQDAHRELVDLLQSNQGDATSPARQIVAARMLEERLLPAPESEAKLQALSFYTTILLETENPDASILLPALRQLTDHWSGEKIAEAVEATRERAQVYLDRNRNLLDRVEGCVKCSPEQRVSFKAPEGAEAAQVHRLAQIEAALAGFLTRPNA